MNTLLYFILGVLAGMAILGVIFFGWALSLAYKNIQKEKELKKKEKK